MASGNVGQFMCGYAMYSFLMDCQVIEWIFLSERTLRSQADERFPAISETAAATTGNRNR